MSSWTLQILPAKASHPAAYRPKIPSTSNASNAQHGTIQHQQTLITTGSNFAPQPTERQSADYVLLPTVIIYIKNRAGTFIPCRALLDSASQLNFVTSRLANQLQLVTRKSTVSISGISEASLSSKAAVDLAAQSLDRKYSAAFSAVVTRTITDYHPHIGIDITSWNIPKNIALADPSFHKSQRVDVLLGAGLFFELLCVGQTHIARHLPIFQKTRLGWIVSRAFSQPIKHHALAAVRRKSPEDDNLTDIVKRFWEIDSCYDSASTVTEEDMICENLFLKGYMRLETGQYSVRLPAKADLDALGDSFHRALRRFKSVESRLQRNQQLKEQYSAFLQEYIDLGHMSLASSHHDGPRFYLPHHCVENPDSTSKKLRVVFDGSAKTTTGASLNDLLFAGPTIQSKLFNILIRFRFFKFAMCGDISKMYRCVRISPPDQHLQCILWRNNSDEPINVYTLNTVTYGTKPAAFLAICAMHQLTYDEEPSFPLAARIV